MNGFGGLGISVLSLAIIVLYVIGGLHSIAGALDSVCFTTLNADGTLNYSEVARAWTLHIKHLIDSGVNVKWVEIGNECDLQPQEGIQIPPVTGSSKPESNKYIDTQAPAVFVNHSCDPNAGIRNDENMVALRDIAAGEEVRFDYSTTMEEQSFTMQCLCGLPQCRHVIKDFSTLPQHLKERYLDLRIVMNFIQDAAARNLSRSPAALCAT